MNSAIGSVSKVGLARGGGCRDARAIDGLFHLFGALGRGVCGGGFPGRFLPGIASVFLAVFSGGAGNSI